MSEAQAGGKKGKTVASAAGAPNSPSGHAVIPQPSLQFATSKFTQSESAAWAESVKPSEGASLPPAEGIDFLLTPYTVERLIGFGMLVCADSFVFLVAMLPFRALLALCSLVKSIVTGRRPVLRFLSQVDLIRVVLMAVGAAPIWFLDLQEISSVVKLSEMKLKMVWMALEFLDKAMTKWGESIIGTMLWAMKAKPEERKWPLWLHIVVAAGYMVLHPLLLLVHLSVLNIAVSGKKMSFFALVVLVQFAELKSFGLKNTDGNKLTDMCHEDICERFELLVLVFLLFIINALPNFRPPQGLKILLALLVLLYLSEMIIDWLKHAAICNTNSLSPGVYLTRLKNLSDAAASESVSGVMNDQSLALSRKIGFWSLPIAVLSLKIAFESTKRVEHRAFLVCGAWVALLVAHCLLRRVVHFVASTDFFCQLDHWLALRDNSSSSLKKKE